MGTSSPRVKWIEKALSRIIPKGLILDIGFAGESEPFLHKKLQDSYPELKIFGIDINIEQVLQQGIKNTLVCNTKLLPFKNDCFDVVLFAEVLEHLDNPFPVFDEIRRVTKPAGILIITTPNVYSWNRFLRWWILPTKPYQRSNYRRYIGAHDHVMFWDPLSLCNILFNYGYIVTDLETTNHRFPLISRLVKSLGSLNLKVFPFNRLGGYLCIIAQKC